MAVQRWAGGRVTCLSGDTKPTTVPAGTELVETDTRRKYYYSGTQWILQELPAYKEFKVYKIGTTTYIADEHGKQVSTPGSDTVAVVQPLLNGMSNGQVYTLIWDANIWDFETPLLMPSVTTTNTLKKVVMLGRGWAGSRNTTGTTAMLQPTTNFPNQRFLIECPNQGDATPKTSQVHIDGFQLRNGLAQGTKDVGGILLEAGSVLNGNYNWVVKNIYGNYLWRGLELNGMIWFGLFENLIFSVSSLGWVGDAEIIITNGGHTGANGPTPKANTFRNISTNSGDGVYNEFLRLSGGAYNYFDYLFIDGKYFANAVLNLSNTDFPNAGVSSNFFQNITTLDLDNTSPNNQKGNLYLHAGTGRVYDNIFRNCRLTNHGTYAVRMDDSGVFRNDIEIVAFWGVTCGVNDTGSGESNTIRLIPGAKITAGETGISHVGGVSRIIDFRRSAERKGTAVISDGGTVSHGLFTTPLWVIAQSRIAGEFCSITARTSTTFTVAIKKHDNTAGTASQTIDWWAGVYA